MRSISSTDEGTSLITVKCTSGCRTKFCRMVCPDKIVEGDIIVRRFRDLTGTTIYLDDFHGEGNFHQTMGSITAIMPIPSLHWFPAKKYRNQILEEAGR
ncbi:MAG: hypothetical protein ACLVCH_13165 [Roseburia inulinivorans]